MKLSELHPRAEALIVGCGDVNLLSELLSEGLATLSEANEAPSLSQNNANHVARATTPSQNNSRDNPPKLPFYVGLVVFSYVNLANLDDIVEFPHIIEHNPEEGQ